MGPPANSAILPQRSILTSVDHWRTRAAEMRVLAEHIEDPIARELMLRTACDCDQLAERAGARARKR